MRSAGGYQLFWRNVSPVPFLKSTRRQSPAHKRHLHPRRNFISHHETDRTEVACVMFKATTSPTSFRKPNQFYFGTMISEVEVFMLKEFKVLNEVKIF